MMRHPRAARYALVLAAACSLLLPSCATLTSSPPAETAIGPLTEQARAQLAVNPRFQPQAEAPATTPAAIPETGPITLTVEQAILLAMEHNQALVVERLNPQIARTLEEQERAVFDPVLTASFDYPIERVRPHDDPDVTRGRFVDVEAAVEASQTLPTGTTLEAGVTHEHQRTPGTDKLSTTRVGLTVTQALLRGYGLDVNLVSLRQARLDVLRSQYELRGFAEDLLAQVEETYWNDVLAQRRIAIFENSLKLAEKQRSEIEERIKVGKLAETELAAAQAEVALRQEGLINARSTLATTRLNLLRLLNPPGVDLWSRQIVTESQPAVPAAPSDAVEAHVELAFQMRPELNQARLDLQRDDLEIVRTRNGLLPRMDLFIALGRSGYAGSFGTSARDFFRGDSYDATVGLSFELPPLNRDARARHERATVTRRQSAEALANLTQLVQVDVRAAYIEVLRTREQVAATAATRTYQEENLRAETEKFRVGKSTSLLVAQVQRDLLSAEIAEIEAVVNHLVALVELYRLDGSLLARSGITAPGSRPVALDDPAIPGP